MTVKDEIVEFLRNGVAVRDIREKTRSKSVLYECLTEYLVELEAKVEATRTSLQQEEEKQRETKSENELLADQKSEFKKDIEALRAESEELGAKVAKQRKEHEELHEDVKLVRDRGFTPEIVNKLKAANIDGAELDALLQQREKRNELNEKVAALEEKESTLTRKIEILPEKIQNLEKKLA